MRALAAGVMMAVLGCVQTLPAQEPPKPTVAEQRTAEALAALRKAVDDANAASKVLLVTFSADAGKAKANDAVLAVPATAGWIARHAVTHSVTDARLIRDLGGLSYTVGDKIDETKRLTQIAGGDPLFFSDGIIDLLDKRSSIVVPNSPKADPRTTAGLGSLALAMRLDWTLRSPVASESFRARHAAQLKPAPWPGAGESKAPSVLAALSAARALARDKQWDQAANAYANAWWETGANTAAAPVRLGPMAAEMALIVQQAPAAKDRLLGLRTEYARAMDVSDMRQVHEYLILCRVVGDHEHNLRFLDEATQNKSASAVLPPGDIMAIDWMMPVCHWNDPVAGVSKPGAWCVQLLRQSERLAARKDAAQFASAAIYGRWLARLEASRRLAWLLSSGQDQRADELRTTVLAADGSADMKRSMVAACLAAGQRRPWLSELLKGVDDEELAAELKK
ncbi:MAG TPA: hypothetical protein VEB22_10810 [Phycisphaerales bacterium]|nr:hypothetical protein [Phycisphaerales bacterium]